MYIYTSIHTYIHSMTIKPCNSEVQEGVIGKSVCFASVRSSDASLMIPTCIKPEINDYVV